MFSWKGKLPQRFTHWKKERLDKEKNKKRLWEMEEKKMLNLSVLTRLIMICIAADDSHKGIIGLSKNKKNPSNPAFCENTNARLEGF